MRTIRRSVASLVSVCLVLSVSGCFSAQEYAHDRGARIEPGMSMEEVQYRLGEPDLILKGDPGSDTEWVYRYEGGTTAVGTVFLVLLAVVLVAAIVVVAAGGGGGGSFGGWGGGGGSDEPPYQIRIHFDSSGRVVEVSPPHPVP